MGYGQLNDGIIQTMKDLRANGWSFTGIARIYSAYGVTANTVQFLVRDDAVAVLVDRAVDLLMNDLAREASDAVDRALASRGPMCRCSVLPIEPVTRGEHSNH